MGVTTYHRGDLLRARTEADARAAIKIINSDTDNREHAMSVADEPVYKKDGTPLAHMTGAATRGEWRLQLDDFNGDHWQDDANRLLWLQLAPLMDSGSFLHLEDEDGGRWRIYFDGQGRVWEQGLKRIVWNTPGAQVVMMPGEKVAP